jgi:D-sedoheptulose 7-phosphate isomerase
MKVFDDLVENYPDLENCQDEIEAGYQALLECFRNGHKMLVCGNGGSAADALHIVGELMKGFESQRPLSHDEISKLRKSFPMESEYLSSRLQRALPAISLMNEIALTTAYANDVDPDMVFAQQVFGLGQAGDVFLAISTSGNAKNVINAMMVANAFGLRTIGLTGPDGGMFNSVCDLTIHAPGESTLTVQERHLPIYHALCLALEKAFFPS